MAAQVIAGRRLVCSGLWWPRADVQGHPQSPWSLPRGRKVVLRRNGAAYGCHNNRENHTCDRPGPSQLRSLRSTMTALAGSSVQQTRARPSWVAGVEDIRARPRPHVVAMEAAGPHWPWLEGPSALCRCRRYQRHEASKLQWPANLSRSSRRRWHSHADLGLTCDRMPRGTSAVAYHQGPPELFGVRSPLRWGPPVRVMGNTHPAYA